MSFKMKYAITKNLLPIVSSGRRQGIKASKIRFIVLHDVGNDGNNKNGTTAANNINYYRNSPRVQASAHTFIDDKFIYECIPATVGTPEKAWHVLYNKTIDNKMFGYDANDAAIGVELCYFPKDKTRSTEAYNKFIWYCAYLAYHFGLDPKKCFVGHEKLDPGRKTDPSNGLKWIGKTTAQCILDIQKEYNECLGKINSSSASSSKAGSNKEVADIDFEPKHDVDTVGILTDTLNLRKEDNINSPIVRVLKKGEVYKCYGEGKWGYNLGSGWVAKGKEYVKFMKKTGQIGVVTILPSSLNVRKEDNVSSAVVSTVKKGQSFKVYAEGKWGYNVGSGWVSKGAAYVKFTKI